MSSAAKFRTLMHQEPVICWSFIIGGVGLSLPLWVPPLREALGYGRPTPVPPPPVSQVSGGPCAGLFWVCRAASASWPMQTLCSSGGYLN